MSVRSRQSDVAYQEIVPSSPPPYDSIYSTSAPYIPMRGDVKRPLSEILTAPGRPERAGRPLSDLLSSSSRGDRRAYASSSRHSVAETSFIHPSSRSAVHPSEPSQVNYESPQQEPTQHWKPSGLLCIRITPDQGGRYGFRVRGGADLSRPITVGRVIPRGPADLSDPKPQLGDQILFINGVEVSNSSHEEVVKLIRSSHETVGELFLVVKRRGAERQNYYGPTSTPPKDLPERQERRISKNITTRQDVQYHFLGEY